MKGFVISIGALAALAGAAFGADEVINLGGPFQTNVGAANASTSLGASDPTFSVTGGYTLWAIRANGNLVQINGTTGDFVSENRMHLWRPGTLVGQTTTTTMTATGGGYSGTVSWVANSSGVLGFDPAGTWSYRFFNSVDDSPSGLADAELSNVSLEFNPMLGSAPTCVNLGYINPGTFTIHTGGSGFDTELGLYNPIGGLMANDDDGLNSSPGESRINIGSLPNGTYYVALGGYNTGFATGFAVTAGTASGNAQITVSNGTDTLTGGGALASGQIQWYCFTVPTPGSLALLGLGGLVAGRRRR